MDDVISALLVKISGECAAAVDSDVDLFTGEVFEDPLVFLESLLSLALLFWNQILI